MKSPVEVLKSMDQALYRSSEQMRGNSEIGKLIENYNSLEDSTQNITKYIIGAIVLFIPITLFAIFYFSNQSVRSEINTKLHAIELIESQLATEREFQLVSTKYVGATPVLRAADIQNKLSLILNPLQIDSNLFNVTDFQNDESIEGLSNSQAIINFKGINNSQLFNFINALIARQKIYPTALDVKINNETKLLEGRVDISYFGKVLIVNEDN